MSVQSQAIKGSRGTVTVKTLFIADCLRPRDDSHIGIAGGKDTSDKKGVCDMRQDANAHVLHRYNVWARSTGS